MGFLAPWFLLLGGAALVPLLIHLLRRRIGLQVEFPAARYLARAEREHSRTLRMRNLLLMLLRMLAVLMIAMAAARPTARVAGTGHAPTALAIVLDNSLSTSLVDGGTSLLDQFKRTARTALDAATPDDRLWLITADGALRSGGPSALREELERVRPYGGAGDLRDAVARAIAAVDAGGLPAKQVAVLTDGQRTAWRDPSQSSSDVRVVVWAPPANRGGAGTINRAVIAAEARPVRWTPRGAVGARMQSPDSTTYRIALGPRTLARGTVGPDEEAAVRAAPGERGWVPGTVEIEPDELVLDNTRHFALWIGPAPTVQVLPGAGTFAGSAIDVLRSSERVSSATTGGVQLAAADEATSLPALLVPPADPVRVGAANRTLERLGVPWRFGAMRRESAIARGDQLPGVSVALRYQLVPRGSPDADTLAMVGREPWAVGGARYVLLASPLDPAATSFPVSAAFLPWLGDVIASRLHAEPGIVRFVAPGQRVARPSGVDAIESVDGRRLPVTAGGAGGSTIEAPAIAGTYFLIQGSRRVGALVVNPEPEESRLERWSGADLARRVAPQGARVASDPEDWVNRAFSGSARRSLAAPALIVVLLLLAAEMAAASLSARTTR